MYSVKEIFFTLQGEGANTGRAAVFCRFAGCNLWTGHEADRAEAICDFCDTDFVGTNGQGGGKFPTSVALADAILGAWPHDVAEARFVVCTGGEPLLQLDKPLVDALHDREFQVAVETNGTLAAPPGLDWICVSPKAGTQLALRAGDELKLVFPQAGVDPRDFERLAFRNLFIQPMDGLARQRNTAAAVEYCMRHPKWRLSLQTHKLLGIP
jgi:7-carboxy-7-deazaguanine synthase